MSARGFWFWFRLGGGAPVVWGIGFSGFVVSYLNNIHTYIHTKHCDYCMNTVIICMDCCVYCTCSCPNRLYSQVGWAATCQRSICPTGPVWFGLLTHLYTYTHINLYMTFTCTFTVKLMAIVVKLIINVIT